MGNKDTFLDIGIIAYNEEKNIKFLLDELLRQLEKENLVFNITVVASGCTDRTASILRDYVAKDSRIKLLREEKRRGKARAINLFLNNAKGDLLIVSSADIIPSGNMLEEILNVFSEPSIGMVGVRLIPKPSSSGIGLLNSLLWELHHEISFRRPKLGELVAFRNIINKIPEETAADEAAIEALVTQKGLRIRYLPEVVIYNYAPKDLTSFLKKRIRIFVGHLYVKNRMNYKVATYDIIPLISLLINKIKREKNKTLPILFLVSLEIYARLAAFYYFFIRKKTYAIWER